MELTCKTKYYENKISSRLGFLAVLVKLFIAVNKTP